MSMATSMVAAFGNMHWLPMHTILVSNIALLSLPVIVMETIQAIKGCGNEFPFKSRAVFATISAVLISMTIIMFERFRHVFIYFQF